MCFLNQYKNHKTPQWRTHELAWELSGILDTPGGAYCESPMNITALWSTLLQLLRKPFLHPFAIIAGRRIIKIGYPSKAAGSSNITRLWPLHSSISSYSWSNVLGRSESPRHTRTHLTVPIVATSRAPICRASTISAWTPSLLSGLTAISWRAWSRNPDARRLRTAKLLYVTAHGSWLSSEASSRFCGIGSKAYVESGCSYKRSSSERAIWTWVKSSP